MATMCGYGWTLGKSMQIAYVGSDKNIHEIYRTAGDPTPRFANLSALCGAAPASDSSVISGFQWVGGKSKHIVYTTDLGHIVELHCDTGWRPAADLFLGNAIADVAHVVNARVGGSICGFDWSAENTKQIVYLGDDFSIQELSIFPGGTQYSHANLSQITGTQKIAPSNAPLLAYDWTGAGMKQVVFSGLFQSGADPHGHLHWLSVRKSGKWQHQDLTAAANAPSQTWADAAGFASAMGRGPDGNFVVCRDAANGLHLFVAPQLQPVGSFVWTHFDLSKNLPGAIGNITSNLAAFDWTHGKFREIFFITQDGHVHELYQPFGSAPGLWSHADLTALTKAPVAQSNQLLIAFEWPDNLSKHVIYSTADRNLHELSCKVGGAWSALPLTDGSASRPTAN
jgi:hypothetical protein